MGNCTNCVQQQQQQQQQQVQRTSNNSSTFDSSRSHNTRHGWPSRSAYSRPHSPVNLNELIDETLLIIRTVVDTDQEPPHAMLLVSRIANRDDRWLDVVFALIERIPIIDPLGATVIALLLDECSLPSKELLQQLIKRICINNRIRIKILETIIDQYITQMMNVRNLSQQTDQRTVNSSIQTHVGRARTTNEEDEFDRINETTPAVINEHFPIVEEQQQITTPSPPKLSAFASLRSSKRSSSLAKTIASSDLSMLRNINNEIQPKNDLHQERNSLVVLGCLAEKLVGPSSASMLNSSALEFIIDRVYLGLHGYEQLRDLDEYDDNSSINYSTVLKIILFALIALEKFAQTPESKHVLFQSLTLPTGQLMNVLEYFEPWAISKNCLKRQIGFYAQWLLDNVFLLTYRRPSYETLDHTCINVMLNDKDVSEYLKIGPDGLEARSDTVSFESVRCTFNVRSGVWYYEVLIVTDGVMQIGWATKQSKFMNHEGYGIGDDQYSIAYDGCRNLLWYNAKAIPHTNPAWKPGDIVGCLIDFDRREVIFSLNGRALDPFRKLFTSSSSSISHGYFAAASFMSFQHCRFNFGSIPFRYPPLITFKSFNEYAHLADDEKLILPRYKKLELLRATQINEQDCILCVDDRATIKLKPCQHTGFCERCSMKLDICPICRSDIRERSLITT